MTRFTSALRLFTLAAVMVAVALGGAVASAQAQAVRLPAPDVRPEVPQFPKTFEWLNTDQPLALDGNLKGHVVVLDFWTYCCINCMHILPDLEYLETKYADQPVMVIGVHSAKFEAEGEAENIRQAIQRYRIHHPVIVDQDFAVWNSYGANAWPTFAIIDSAGRIVGRTSGEGKRELLDDVIGQLLEEGRKDGTLADKPLKLKPTAIAELNTGTLQFPGKVTAAGERLFIADSNHDRVLVTDLSGKLLHTIGSGEDGLKDGSFGEAQFSNPQGIAVRGDVAYVADTDNHVIRRMDLGSKQVTTIAGTGKQSYDRSGGLKGTEQGLASPWDVVLEGDRLFIAQAGTHQLWVHNLKTGVTEAFSGSGRESIIDGSADSAQLAQPSGLAIKDGWLYFADSEVSAVRRASLKDGSVQTLIGKGLFEFGHVDGAWDQALMQHVLGVAVLGDELVVADTYNDAIRVMDLKAKTVRTPKLTGPGADLDEPAGLAVHNGQVYVADTNNHRIVRVDPKTWKATVVSIDK